MWKWSAMRLTIDGAEFDVRDEGRGPAVVLLHGFPLAKETWDAQAAALRSRARVIRFDLRGLGTTTATPGPYLMEQLAGDVAEILDALDIERAALVGHSLGGYVAFAFFRMFAERCSGLGLVCSRASADSTEQAADRRALAGRAEREGMEPIIGAFVPKYFAPSIYREQPELVERITAFVRQTVPAGAAAMLRGMAERVDSTDLFEEMQLPVGVVAGARDALIDQAQMRAIADGVAGAEIDLLDCGHFPLYEAPQALVASLERLLARAS
jgi:pimeloyl-ACP methyl ester carboxylesterase